MTTGDSLTTKEAAELLGVSPATIVNYANKRLIPFRRLPGQHRRFSRSDLERFREEHTFEPAASDPAVAPEAAS